MTINLWIRHPELVLLRSFSASLQVRGLVVKTFIMVFHHIRNLRTYEPWSLYITYMVQALAAITAL